MSVSAKIEVKSYVEETVEEELYAGSTTVPATTTTPLKVASGKIRDGFDGVVVSIAITQNAVCSFFLKIKEKQYYADGLNSAALGGLSDETLLLVKIAEGVAWEIGLTNTSGANIVQNWRFRIRLFKK